MAPPKVKNAAALAMHKKWQEAAIQMGGEGAKIVVSKQEAKPLILACLRDSYRPMTITDIFKRLKAVVPSPVLKACLDEMAVSNRTDGSGSDEEEIPQAASGKKEARKTGADDDFSDAVCVKLGRSVGGSLYYANQEKMDNKGNGLLPDERNELVSDSQKASQEKMSISANLDSMNSEIKGLLCEPTNNEADVKISSEEQLVANLQEKLQESRRFLANEKKCKNTRKRVQHLADHWWKRRRLCMDFLLMIEECTEGAVSVKKCLAGNGQIEIESDEAVIRESVEAFKSRSSRTALRKKNEPSSRDAVEPTANFVGMKMNPRGTMSRVYAEP